MKIVVCKSCGSNDLYEENGYQICRYCGTKFLITADDKPARTSDISLNKDVENLMKKCREDPARAQKYAELILEIDPNNTFAYRILHPQQETKQGGCYVATAVYGSYDCPEVWTLRRFRDNSLSKSISGRAFIRAYYAVSPTLVKRFGSNSWFRNTLKPVLDGIVKRLNDRGIENTPYSD